MFLFELQAYSVVFRSDQIGQAVRHPQYKKDRGVYPDRDAGIAFFNLYQRRATYRRTLRRDSRRDAPPPPGITNVAAELSQRSSYRYWQYHG
jgi:hypothetical protein